MIGCLRATSTRWTALSLLRPSVAAAATASGPQTCNSDLKLRHHAALYNAYTRFATPIGSHRSLSNGPKDVSSELEMFTNDLPSDIAAELSSEAAAFTGPLLVDLSLRRGLSWFSDLA